MSDCPCGSGGGYESCCRPYHAGERHAPTAEALMRSRYSAYALGEIDYLGRTLSLLQRKTFDRRMAREWSKQAEWLGLEIVSANGGEGDKAGRVEFIARFRQGGEEHTHHEISRFEHVQGRWLYVDGKILGEN
ncbi:MAG: YchJ family protein [Bdellovibrionales bacterium]|nr:YchJ family protein [Bdellovibrionales bacterium]